jgi:tetratricopeptide (TPR) repeat protein
LDASSEWKEAVRDFEAAIRLDPTLKKPYRHLAQLYMYAPDMDRKDYKKAIKFLKIVAKSNSWADKTDLTALADAYRLTGENEMAIRYDLFASQTEKLDAP